MRVTFENDPTAHFEDVWRDVDFALLIDQVRGNRLARVIVGAVLASFRKPSEQADGLSNMIRFFARSHPASPADLEELCDEIGPRLSTLYGRFHPTRIRGAVVERLVFEQISDRYRHNNLEANVFVNLENGLKYKTPKSVDVAGWDGNRGECHDCKTRAREFDLAFARDLESSLQAPSFKIGLVCVDSELPMVRTLTAAGYVPAAHTTLIPLERLWDLAPLQAA